MTTSLKGLKYFVPAAIVLAGLMIAATAYANPFYTGPSAASATATSSQVFLTAGVSTSTTVYDSYEQYGTNQPNSGNITLPDSVAVLLNGVASSTSSVITVACEYSNNYNGATGNGDWYQNEIYPATSTGPLTIAVPLSFSFQYAASTVGGVLLPGTQYQKVIVCPVPTRFVRAVVSVTGASASVYTGFVPKKQRN